MQIIIVYQVSCFYQKVHKLAYFQGLAGSLLSAFLYLVCFCLAFIILRIIYMCTLMFMIQYQE